MIKQGKKEGKHVQPRTPTIPSCLTFGNTSTWTYHSPIVGAVFHKLGGGGASLANGAPRWETDFGLTEKSDFLSTLEISQKFPAY